MSQSLFSFYIVAYFLMDYCTVYMCYAIYSEFRHTVCIQKDIDKVHLGLPVTIACVAKSD